MNKLIFCPLIGCLLLFSCWEEVGGDEPQQRSEKWISEIIEYRPAPGQFINTSLGDTSAAKSIIGGATGTVSLGGYGGSITFRFNHDVENRSGVDFVIKSDAFAGSSEPAVVAVSYDANGNGKADDVFYELAGDGYEALVKNYTMTWMRPADLKNASDISWHDSATGDGVFSVEYIQHIHRQCYYPLFLFDQPSELTFTGTLIPSNAVIKNGIWVLEGIGNGYACNLSDDWNDIIGGDEDTKHSNKFDLSNAVDQNGKRVDLPRITFVKVYTAVHANCGELGETSTEICGAISLSRK